MKLTCMRVSLEKNLVPKADSSDDEFDFNDDGLCEVANACSRLCEVHLSGRLHIGDVGVVSLIRFSKNLTDLLKLDGCVTAIGEANHLKYLSFRGCYLVTDLGLEYLANGDMKNCLERLHLNECDMISDYGICHLKQMTGLYYLSLSKCGLKPYSMLAPLENTKKHASFAYNLNRPSLGECKSGVVASLVEEDGGVVVELVGMRSDVGMR
ncbi:leucine-rich repeat, cysteine-containing subtype protein [Tanacetum coccineum]